MKLIILSVTAILLSMLIACSSDSTDDISISDSDGSNLPIDSLNFGSCDTRSSDYIGGTMANPTAISSEIVVGGLIRNLDSAAPDFDNSEYWQIDMPAGKYVFVVEASKNFSFNDENRSLSVYQIGGDGSPVIEINKPETFMRQVAIVEIDDESNVFKVASETSPSQFYKLVFYRINDAIPTPQIINCVFEAVTSVGTTEVFSAGDYEQSHYYLIDSLSSGDYRISISLSRGVEELEMLGISISVNNDSNDHRTERTIFSHESNESFSTANVDFSHAETGSLLLRFSKSSGEQNVEFTVEAR